MYGKVVNGALWYAPRKIRLNDYTVFVNNVPSELLIENGYKPIIESKPETPAEEGYHYELSFDDIGDEIIYVWTLVKDEPTSEELLEILIGDKK